MTTSERIDNLQPGDHITVTLNYGYGEPRYITGTVTHRNGVVLRLIQPDGRKVSVARTPGFISRLRMEG